MNLTRRQTLGGLLATGALAPEAEAAEPVARVSFLLVNDVYRISDNADGRGGLSRLAAAVNAERAKAAAENRRLIFVHAGDTLSPSLMSSLDQGAHMIDLFNEIGLDAFVPGNHEFDFGKDVYFQRIAEARFPILAANLRDSAGGKLARHEDHILIDAQGIKIAMIGSAYDQTATASRPGDLVFTPTLMTVPAAAKAAHSAGADFVVAIVHTDRQTGAALMDAHVVDLILSGHNHDLHLDFDGRTALIESQQDANYIGVIDIDFSPRAGAGADFSPGKGAGAAWRPSFRVIDTATVVPDPGLKKKADIYEAKLAQRFDVEIATLAAPLDSRTEIVRTQEAAIGNLFADAIAKTMKADLAILNGGGIRGDKIYPAGAKLKRRDILDELPFSSKSVLTAVSGKNILAALENGLSRLEKRSGRFPQTAGLRVTADPKAPAGARVKSVKVQGEELDLTRTYRVATNDFLVLGGDGYSMLAGESNLSIDSGTRLLALDVMDYVEGLKLIDVKVEGRMVFL